MAAASRAIAERTPLVDLILEVRDARIPLSSQFDQLKDQPPSSKRVIVLNKMDLANGAEVKEWMSYMEHQKQICYGVNSHNRDNIKKFLNFLQAHMRQLKKIDYSSSTITMMLVGVPNVGKSALANSLHKVGRVGAAEKGKLKHATVSPLPCETKDISSFKIASNPNVYVLDTPGILPPVINETEICSKLALTGTIRDSLVGEKELAMYFLSMLNSSEEYKKWAELSSAQTGRMLADCEAACASSSDLDMKGKRRYPSDHTQDFIVDDVRRTLYEEASSFQRKLAKSKDCMRLIELQLEALPEAFRVPLEFGDDSFVKVSKKLLNLYRTGRLGHYTLDSVPNHSHLIL
ncbi:DAR GTPase 2, mitochondrial isoform X2 [Punica granatum]|nr:DAR GTPase 2, mitochondrial isoform X2 [Punica granatum]